MVEQQSTLLVPGLLKLTYVRNIGAAFGLFPGRQPVFIFTSLLVLFVVAAFWRRARPTQWPVVIALALVTAGAVGNLIDRIVLGYVTDFFEFGFMEFPVFNVADSAISDRRRDPHALDPFRSAGRRGRGSGHRAR